MENAKENKSLRLLCPKLVLCKNEPGLQWLTSFLPPFTLVSTLKCIHLDDSYYNQQSEDLRTLLLKGFDIVGALMTTNSNIETNIAKAIGFVCSLRKLINGGLDKKEALGVVADSDTGKLHFFASESVDSTS